MQERVTLPQFISAATSILQRMLLRNLSWSHCGIYMQERIPLPQSISVAFPVETRSLLLRKMVRQIKDGFSVWEGVSALIHFTCPQIWERVLGLRNEVRLRSLQEDIEGMSFKNRIQFLFSQSHENIEIAEDM
jgi:hypothetical protein